MGYDCFSHYPLKLIKYNDRSYEVCAALKRKFILFTIFVTAMLKCLPVNAPV